MDNRNEENIDKSIKFSLQKNYSLNIEKIRGSDFIIMEGFKNKLTLNPSKIAEFNSKGKNHNLKDDNNIMYKANLENENRNKLNTDDLIWQNNCKENDDYVHSVKISRKNSDLTIKSNEINSIDPIITSKASFKKINHNNLLFLNNFVKFDNKNDKFSQIKSINNPSLITSSLEGKKNSVKFEKVNNMQSLNSNSKNNQKLCKICYEKEDKADDKIINPCFCEGTMKYIHENCLKQWIQKKDNMSYIRCEICKYEYKIMLHMKYKFSLNKMSTTCKNLVSLIIIASVILSLVFSIFYILFEKYHNLVLI